MGIRPYQVGITGGIGAGKSMVCKIFNRLGVPSYDADSRARWLMDHDSGLKASIQKEFGSKAYLQDGSLNRPRLSQLVFGEDSRIDALNQLVHPAVGKDYSLWVTKNQENEYLLKEAALIFETGSEKMLDRVITVFAPEAKRIDRILIRDPNRNRDQIKGIISKQGTEENRQKHADYVIRNDDLSLVIPQVLQIHDELLTVRAKDPIS